MRAISQTINYKWKRLFNHSNMILQEETQDRKVRLNDQKYEIVISHNIKMSCLEVTSKCYNKETIYWGRFTLSDFDRSIQTLFDSIDSLFDYITENTQQIELNKSFINIRLNFLKQTKELTLKLLPMIMCSQYQNESLHKKIKQLQNQNTNLKINNEGSRKLTFQLLPHTVNFRQYMITNFTNIKHQGKAKPLNIFRICKENTLPIKGIFMFQILIVNISPNISSHAFQVDPKCFDSKQKSFMEIGIKNNQNQKSTLILNQEDIRQTIEGNRIMSLNKNQLFNIAINMDLKKIIVIKKFQREQQIISWSSFKNCDKLWLYLSCYKLEIITNLFVEDDRINWQKNEKKLQEIHKKGSIEANAD